MKYSFIIKTHGIIIRAWMHEKKNYQHNSNIIIHHSLITFNFGTNIPLSQVFDAAWLKAETISNITTLMLQSKIISIKQLEYNQQCQCHLYNKSACHCTHYYLSMHIKTFINKNVLVNNNIQANIWMINSFLSSD